MNPLGLIPPAAQAKITAQADKRIAGLETETIVFWPDAELRYTLPGYVHGIVGHQPWEIQCDGCGTIQTIRFLAACTIWFRRDTENDPRRLCPTCRDRAGWRRT